jgi:hypothetical protein
MGVRDSTARPGLLLLKRDWRHADRDGMARSSKAWLRRGMWLAAAGLLVNTAGVTFLAAVAPEPVRSAPPRAIWP